MDSDGKTGTRARRPNRARIQRWLPALSLACLSALAHAQVLEVRIAGQEALMPKWVHLRNRVAGICPDILMDVERIEPRLHFVGYRQSRSLSAIEMGLENGSLDAACGLATSPHRRATAQPAGPPLYVVRHRLVGRADDAVVIRTLQDLVRMDALVVAPRGTLFSDELRAAGVRVDDATDDNGVNLRKLMGGHGRFVDINELTLRHFLRDQELAQRLRIQPIVLKQEPSYFWVSRKSDPAIAGLLAAALDKLRTSGELERIYALHAANP